MTEAQVLNLALTVIPMMTIVLVGILLNNARLNDVRDQVKEVRDQVNNVRGEVRDQASALRTEFRSEIGGVRDVLRAEMEKNHSEMLHRFADLDTRLTRLENNLGMGR